MKSIFCFDLEFKTPLMLYQRWLGTIITLLVDLNFFFLIEVNNIITKSDKELIMVLLSYDYRSRYESGLTVSYYIFYEVTRIQADILVHFNKSLELFNKNKTSSKNSFQVI